MLESVRDDVYMTGVYAGKSCKELGLTEENIAKYLLEKNFEDPATSEYLRSDLSLQEREELCFIFDQGAGK